MDRIDFRSDTVSWPTPEMRQAMAQAVVGDDVYGEDPTVNALEARAAELAGMDAGIFVSSGTQGNLTAILTHANRGDEAIVGEDSHTYWAEAGGMASLGGIFPRPLSTDKNGRMDLIQVEAMIQPDDPHFARTRLILVENSYNTKGGAVVPLDYFAGIRHLADNHNLKVHLDGARLFNAAVALNKPASALTEHVDSVQFCLSKGLCAPVGSMLCGSHEFIHQARRVRKSLGGGMRQAGILAAAGLVALNGMIERLADDHSNAQRLATALAEIPGITVNMEAVQTNIIFFELDAALGLTAGELARRVKENAGILIDGYGQSKKVRLITHYWVGEKEVDLLVNAVRVEVT